MASIINNPRRDQGKIKGSVKSQKPSCQIIIYPWGNPEVMGFEALNLEKGKMFNNQESADLGLGDFGKPIYIDNDIVKCDIHKNKNSSSGGFSLVLKRGNREFNGQGKPVVSNPIDYLRLINPGDWIAIYMRNDDNIKIGSNSVDSGLKMIGVIENVRYVEIDDPNQGRPRLEYVVSGRDFGKVFENEIYFNPVTTDIPELEAILGTEFFKDSAVQFADKSRKGLTPDEAVKNAIDFYLGGELNSVNSTNKVWYVPGGLASLMGKGSKNLKFTELLNKEKIGRLKYNSGNFNGANKLLGQCIIHTAPASGTVWQVMQHFSNPLLNEMIVDLTNVGKKIEPAIQLRQRPYSNKKSAKSSLFKDNTSPRLAGKSKGEETFFVELPKHTITSTDIKQKNVGKSDFERINCITVIPSLPVSSQKNNINVSYTMGVNIPSIKRYGLKPLAGNTIFTAATDLTFQELTDKYVSLLADWYMNAHLLYNGVIITDGTNNLVEVGSNLFISDIQQLYHIEGISYNYEINPESSNTIYNTEFRVSRGHSTDKSGKITNFIERAKPNKDSGDTYTSIVTNTIENIRNKK